MSRLPGKPHGRTWTQSENNVLRCWAEYGYTVKQMVAMTEDWFGEFINDASLRNHLNYLGIKYNHERRKAQTTPEQREWMRKHYHLPINDLAELFNSVFQCDMPMRVIYKLAYRVGNEEREKGYTDDGLAEDWEQVRQVISPDGKIKPKHWLWRYYPLDEDRKASGVTFRGMK